MIVRINVTFKYGLKTVVDGGLNSVGDVFGFSNLNIGIIQGMLEEVKYL